MADLRGGILGWGGLGDQGSLGTQARELAQLSAWQTRRGAQLDSLRQQPPLSPSAAPSILLSNSPFCEVCGDSGSIP